LGEKKKRIDKTSNKTEVVWQWIMVIVMNLAFWAYIKYIIDLGITGEKPFLIIALLMIGLRGTEVSYWIGWGVEQLASYVENKIREELP